MAKPHSTLSSGHRKRELVINAHPITANWSIITAGLSSILGSMLTILATPSLQHHFWKRQKANLQLKAIDDVNTLTAQFIQQWIATDGRSEQYQASQEWYEHFSAADMSVKALFKKETYEMFKQLEIRVDPTLGTDIRNPIQNVNAFMKVRDVAVKALYSEVI